MDFGRTFSVLNFLLSVTSDGADILDLCRLPLNTLVHVATLEVIATAWSRLNYALE